jgi:ribosome-associated toxin RatA of RatAB toxin-antitoxin module
MKHVKKAVLVWYSAHEMYRLVTDIASYPKFLPWCERAEVLATHDDGVTARLHMGFGGMRHAFTTRNRHVADQAVVVELVDGPFSRLDGTWQFDALKKPGEADAQGCKVALDLCYAFSGHALELMVSPMFDRIANTLIDAFVKRAEQVYGAR